MANCLVNADYYGRQGVVIIKKRDNISFSNPGGFRIEIAAAKSGGISHPRNGTMLKMFNLINIGERAGSGIPNIYAVWNKQGWKEPVITETFEPDRINLSLTMINERRKNGDKISATKNGDKKSAITEKTKMKIIGYLTDNASATCSEIAEILGLQASRSREYLSEMIKEGVLESEGANRNRRYRLKK